jgi:hypothetical protein
VLGHLLDDDGHRERVEPAAPPLLGGPEGPHAGRLGLGRQPLKVLGGDVGGVRVDALLDRDDLVADEAPHLFAQEVELVGQLEAGK